jgi:hypothetical protein
VHLGHHPSRTHLEARQLLFVSWLRCNSPEQSMTSRSVDGRMVLSGGRRGWIDASRSISVGACSQIVEMQVAKTRRSSVQTRTSTRNHVTERVPSASTAFNGRLRPRVSVHSCPPWTARLSLLLPHSNYMIPELLCIRSSTAVTLAACKSCSAPRNRSTSYQSQHASSMQQLR